MAGHRKSMSRPWKVKRAGTLGSCAGEQEARRGAELTAGLDSAGRARELGGHREGEESRGLRAEMRA
jgi:hypothetical protein